MFARLALPVLFLAAVFARGAAAGPVDEAKSYHDLGNRLLEAGRDLDDAKKLREGVDALRKARDLYRKALEDDALPVVERNILKGYLVDVESKVEWWSALFPESKGPAVPVRLPEVKVPAPAKGELLDAWCAKVRTIYDAQKDPLARAAVAQRLATGARAQALPTLLALLASEGDPKARGGLRDALALVGGSDLASSLGDLSTAPDARLRGDALEVVYLCLRKPERLEPERPWCRTIRRFHERKDKAASMEILRRLDAMGWSGTAALGDVLYIDDFGCQSTAIDMLSRKRDRRAVPPLVHKMDRFSFEYVEQFPAHKALLAMGWYAVPELIEHLDDPAAGIWVSWTLRKISGLHAGTTKLKWDDWWKGERLRHPELDAVPDEERAEAGTTPTVGDPPPK